MTDISVIIPTFNRARLVNQAIESVLRQAHEPLEIIVIDDGSTDNTRQLVSRFGNRCRYVHQVNQGPAAARNNGMALAQGDIIALLDSDDIWLPNKVATELRLFKQYPQADMLAGDAGFYLEDKLVNPSIFDRRGIHFKASQPRWFNWSMTIMTQGPVCNTSAMTFKRSAFKKLDNTFFDTRFRLDEDWDLEFRLFSRCQVLLYPDIVCHARAFDDDTRPYTVWGKARPLVELQQMWRNQVTILERYLHSIDWDVDTQLRFLQRRDELQALLADHI